MSNLAESFYGYMVPVLFGPWASRLVQSANPQHGNHVPDLAYGTGIVARYVAPRLGANGAVTGVDRSPYMPAEILG